MTVTMNTAISVQRNNDENFGLDPVTYEQMTDPVIDQAGHTFDRTTIAILSAREGGNPRCPIGREVINVGRLVSNILGRDAIEHVNRANSEITRLNTDLETARRNQQVPQEDKELLELVRKIAQDNQELKAQVVNQGNSINKLTKETKIFRKQLDNVASMSISDKILITYGPLAFYNNHLQKVLNRGLSQANQEATLPSSNQNPVLPSSNSQPESISRSQRIKNGVNGLLHIHQR